jgi:hypothetical protein
MYRRALLVSLAGLSGCMGLVSNPLGGGTDSAAERSGSEGGEPDAQPREDDETPGTPGTETPTGSSAGGTPSPAELRRMSVDELIHLGREGLDRAIDAYAGAGESLTAVTAATDGFDPTPVIEHLYGVRAAAEAANRQGVTAEQRRTIGHLRRVEGLLRIAIDVQVLLVEVHADLGELAGAVEHVDPETVASVVDRIATRRRRANEGVSDLSQARYAQSVTVVDRLSRAEYDDKRRQFTAELDAVRDVVEAMGGVIDGVELLSRARGKLRSGSPYAAAALAKDAEAAFRRGTTALEGAVDGLPRRGRGFAAAVTALLTVAEERRLEARELHRRVA